MMREIIACLYTDGKDLIKRVKLIMQEGEGRIARTGIFWRWEEMGFYAQEHRSIDSSSTIWEKKEQTGTEADTRVNVVVGACGISLLYFLLLSNPNITLSLKKKKKPPGFYINFI